MKFFAVQFRREQCALLIRQKRNVFLRDLLVANLEGRVTEQRLDLQLFLQGLRVDLVQVSNVVKN
jgi:hypothetical protein